MDQATAHTRLIDEAPTGNDWLHEIKYDGYRMHARLDNGRIQLLTLNQHRRGHFEADAGSLERHAAEVTRR